MNINSIFFPLIRLGAGFCDSIALPAMDRALWNSVFSMAQKQAVLGIVLDAVNRLPEWVNKLDKDLLMKLIGFGMEIERRNRVVNREVIRWCGFFEERGVLCSAEGSGGGALLP